MPSFVDETDDGHDKDVADENEGSLKHPHSDTAKSGPENEMNVVIHERVVHSLEK